jgi:hypothetical protein
MAAKVRFENYRTMPIKICAFFKMVNDFLS